MTNDVIQNVAVPIYMAISYTKSQSAAMANGAKQIPVAGDPDFIGPPLPKAGDPNFIGPSLPKAGEVLYRVGEPVAPIEKQLEHYLNPDGYIQEVVDKYGINLSGSGQKITIQYDPNLVPYGKSGELNPNVIVVGPNAMVDEVTLANTIAHELSHSRDYIRGAGNLHPELHKPHGNADSLNLPGGDHTVYGSGNALESYINGER